MQSYYASISSHSPLPVREMNGQDTRGRPFAHKARFDFGNIIGDPFALATVSIGFVSAPLGRGLGRVNRGDSLAGWRLGIKRTRTLR